MCVKAKIYCINKRFLIFKKEDALKLRRTRLLGKLIGCSTINPHQLAANGFPYLISHYATKVALKRGFATFKSLTLDEAKGLSPDRKTRYSNWMVKNILESKNEYEEKRKKELRSHHIVIEKELLDGFDERKMKIKVPDEPEERWSIMGASTMTTKEVDATLDINEDRMLVFEDLYEKGLYLDEGSKFGCDFLGYVGDPLRYHARYAICLVPYDEVGNVELDNIDYNEINSFNRLSHNANKVPLLVTRYGQVLKYWELLEKQYLGPHSKTEHLRNFSTTAIVAETDTWQHCVSESSCSNKERESKMRKVI